MITDEGQYASRRLFLMIKAIIPADPVLTPLHPTNKTTLAGIPRCAMSTRTNSRKRKRKNPLSAARKSNDFFDTLWHKKSGLGFALFVQYYGQQPLGVVVSRKMDLETQSDDMPTKNPCQLPKGMSRAAKRRRRKKNGERKPIKIAVPPEVHSQKKAESLSSSTELQDSSKESSLAYQLGKHPEYARLGKLCKVLSKPLPISFRLRNVKRYGNDQQQYKKNMSELEMNLKDFNDYVRPITSKIYQGSLDKSSLSNAISNGKELKELLISASSQGLLARQEIGSMLPVVGLVTAKILRANAFVIDMCASPGSKTLQLVEIVGPKGKIWANDVHPKRLEALEGALKRSGVPLTDRIVLKNFDASNFPSSSPQPHVVLADVPCSGDGTIRKDPSILPVWSPATARSLHTLQIKILWRALEIVRVGGVVSYSTCSLNPIENEAVVQAVLLKAMEKIDGGKPSSPLELCKFPDLDGIKLRPGVSEWKALDHSLEDEDDVVRWTDISCRSKNTPEERDSTLSPSTLNKDLKLERCRRLLPQDNDTGGFFVAFIRKTTDLPSGVQHTTNNA